MLGVTGAAPILSLSAIFVSNSDKALHGERINNKREPFQRNLL